MEDIFAIQSEIAQEIADSLQAKLSPAEATKLATAPTKDTAAYDLFLKGEFEERVANSISGRNHSTRQRAGTGSDCAGPEFCTGHRATGYLPATASLVDRSVERSGVDGGRQIGKTGADPRARSRRSTCRARSVLLLRLPRYEPALTEFRRAIELQPNNSLALQLCRLCPSATGKWDRTLEELKRSIDLNPRDPYTRAGSRRPMSFAHVERSGRRCPACPHNRPARGHRHAYVAAEFSEPYGNAQEPLRLLATFPPDDLLLPNTGMFDMVIGTRGQTFVLGRDFNAALKACETGTVARTNEWQRFAAKAGIRVLAGDVTGAHADAEKARELLEARLREQPNDFRSLRALSWVYLALDRKADAINIARHTLDLLPPEKDAVLGSGNLAPWPRFRRRPVLRRKPCRI